MLKKEFLDPPPWSKPPQKVNGLFLGPKPSLQWNLFCRLYVILLTDRQTDTQQQRCKDKLLGGGKKGLVSRVGKMFFLIIWDPTRSAWLHVFVYTYFLNEGVYLLKYLLPALPIPPLECFGFQIFKAVCTQQLYVITGITITEQKSSYETQWI